LHRLLGREVHTSAECGGINYAVRYREGTLEIRGRPFPSRTLKMEIGEIKSIELLRKSVMPPAVIGVVCLALGSILGIGEKELAAIAPLSLRTPLELLTLGVAVICLIILIFRWFLSSIVLKPAGSSAITVRMVPTSSARRLLTLIQQAPPPK
jgi:hypothetical protein